MQAHIQLCTFSIPETPRNICTSPDDSKLYIANWNGFSMTAYSTLPPYQILATVPVDYWPQAILASPDDKYVLVANFGFDFSYDHCSVIRTSDWQVIARLQTGAGPEDMVSIGESGQYLYVSNWGRPVVSRPLTTIAVHPLRMRVLQPLLLCLTSTRSCRRNRPRINSIHYLHTSDSTFGSEVLFWNGCRSFRRVRICCE